MNDMATPIKSAVAGDAPALFGQDFALVGHVPVTLMAQIGSVSITVEQLFKLRCGDVVAMAEALDAPVTLLLNGKAIARGELLAVDDQLGVRVTELA
jgi:flagellar motor switch protein FliN/FliY